MGMAASQARLLSITSRMADNELKAQIINNSKMRLASESSKVSDNYIQALNSATMMISTCDEEGNSQYQKLSFNSLTSFSSYNNQYGLVDANGRLLVNEKEAKLFRSAGGDLNTYLEAHDLEYKTNYFDNYKKTAGTNLYLPYFVDEHHPGYSIDELERKYTEEYNQNLQSPEYESYIELSNSYRSAYYDFTMAIDEKVKDTYQIKLDEIKELLSNVSNSDGDENIKAGITFALGNKLRYFVTGTVSSNTNITDPSQFVSVTQYVADNSSFINTFNQYYGKIKNDYDFGEYIYHNMDLPILTNEYTKSETSNNGKFYFGPIKTVTDDDNTPPTVLGEYYSFVAEKNVDGSYNIHTNPEIIPYLTTTDENDITTQVSYAYEPEVVGDLLKVKVTETTTKGEEEPVERTRTYIIPKNETEECAIGYQATAEEYTNYMLEILAYVEANYIPAIRDKFSKEDPDLKDKYDRYQEEKNKLLAFLYEEGSLYPDDIENHLNEIDWLIAHKQDPGVIPTEAFDKIEDIFVIDCLFAEAGEPTYAWIDTNTGNPAEAKVSWYTNLFDRMQKGYKVLEDGLASSNEWIQFALESGLVTMEQVDNAKEWVSTLHTNVSSITEVTDDVAVTKAEAEYKKAMNNIENKDKRYDIELKNIDTEHNSLQKEYESVKKVIDQNIQRTFKIYS